MKTITITITITEPCLKTIIFVEEEWWSFFLWTVGCIDVVVAVVVVAEFVDLWDGFVFGAEDGFVGSSLKLTAFKVWKLLFN